MYVCMYVYIYYIYIYIYIYNFLKTSFPNENKCKIDLNAKKID